MEGIILKEHFATLQDPLVGRIKRHQLLTIIEIALCAGVEQLHGEELEKAKQDS